MSGSYERAALFKKLLSWYAQRISWSATRAAGHYSGSQVSPAMADSGRLARAAVAAPHGGKLLSAVCDAWQVPLTELARRAGVPEVDAATYVSTGALDDVSVRKLVQALEDMTS